MKFLALVQIQWYFFQIDSTNVQKTKEKINKTFGKVSGI